MVIQEQEFREKLYFILFPLKNKFDCVTGPGRSGAVAAVYASHYLHIPYIPPNDVPASMKRVLVVDTASHSGVSLRKLASKLTRRGNTEVSTKFCFAEPPIVRFWYEDIPR